MESHLPHLAPYGISGDPMQNVPNLSQPVLGHTPLAKLLREKRAQPEFARYRYLANLFKSFHLKHTVTTKVNGRRIEVDGKQLLNFGSANYLGLEQHPKVRAASKRAIDLLGTHAGCSRVFSSQAPLVELEAELSSFVGAESTMVGHSISQIHAGVIPALFSQKGAILFVDKFAHTSMFQAALMATAKGARIIRVDVGDLAGLKKILRENYAKVGAIFVDGVYSMQGHIPQLQELNAICLKHDLLLYIDDAHGVATLGRNGGGVMESANLSFENILLTGSLQKGLGSYGGFISGKKAMIDFLRVSSKAYVFSGTLQPAAVAGAREAVRIARSKEGRLKRDRLRQLSVKVRGALREMGFRVPAGDSPIVPILIGGDMKTLMAGRKMFDAGIFLNSVLYPAVPLGEGILRISLNSNHTDEQIDHLLSACSELRNYLAKQKNPIKSAVHLVWEVGKSHWQKDSYAGLA